MSGGRASVKDVREMSSSRTVGSVQEESIAEKLYTRSEQSLLNGEWDVSSPVQTAVHDLTDVDLDLESESGKKEADFFNYVDDNDITPLSPSKQSFIEMLRETLPYWGAEGMENLEKAVRGAVSSLDLDEVNKVDDETGENALLLCAQYGVGELVEVLVSVHAQVNSELPSGARALHYTTNASTLSYSATDRLLKSGADPNCQEQHHGATPLHYAADAGDADLCRLLLSFGADSTIRDFGGHEASAYAEAAGHSELSHFLQQRDLTVQEIEEEQLKEGDLKVALAERPEIEEIKNEQKVQFAQREQELIQRAEVAEKEASKLKEALESIKSETLDLRQALDSARSENSDLRTALDSAKSENSLLCQALDSTKSEGLELGKAIDSAQLESTELRQTLNTTETENHKLEKALASAEASLTQCREDLAEELSKVEAILSEKCAATERAQAAELAAEQAVYDMEAAQLERDEWRSRAEEAIEAKEKELEERKHILHQRLLEEQSVQETQQKQEFFFIDRLESGLKGLRDDAIIALEKEVRSVTEQLGVEVADKKIALARAEVAEVKASSLEQQLCALNAQDNGRKQADDHQHLLEAILERQFLTIQIPRLRQEFEAAICATLGEKQQKDAEEYGRLRSQHDELKAQLEQTREALDHTRTRAIEHDEKARMEATGAREALAASEAKCESLGAELLRLREDTAASREQQRQTHEKASAEIESFRMQLAAAHKQIEKLLSSLKQAEQKTKDALIRAEEAEHIASRQGINKAAEEKFEVQLAASRSAAVAARADFQEAERRADQSRKHNHSLMQRAEACEAAYCAMEQQYQRQTDTYHDSTQRAHAELCCARAQLAATEADLNAKSAEELRALDLRNAQLDRDLTRETMHRKLLHNKIEDMKGKIRVLCRVRPLSETEKRDATPVALVKDGKASVTAIPIKGEKKRFTFDAIFDGANNSQSKLFEDVRNLVTSAVDGYNVCLFAFGQTGSGKTYTIGTSANIGESIESDGSVTEHAGIAQRTACAVFEILDERSAQCDTEVHLSMYEVYCDKIIDLLNPKCGNTSGNLKVTLAEHSPTGLVAVEGSHSITTNSVQALVKAMAKGISARTTHATRMNHESSRSHLIMTLEVRTKNRRTGAVVKGKITLVDLAGSERVEKSGATGDRLKEATAINKSLSALGDVISSLTTANSAHVPYRNHPLTMLMSDSLGGSAKTMMIVCTSPAQSNFQETFSSLNFATRCKSVTSNDPRAAAAELGELRNEVARLRKLTLKNRSSLIPASVHGASSVAPRAPAVLSGPRIIGAPSSSAPSYSIP